MANPRVSEETNEILDRLKKEGDLLRNRGAHSVKSVKIELGKFEGLFDTIANNVMEQTEMMRETLGIERDRVRELERQNELDELKNERVMASPLSPVREETTRDGGVIALLGSAMKGILGGLGKLAIGGAIGIASAAALWQVAKGFIDEKMGAGTADDFLDSTIQGIKDFKDNVVMRAPKVIGESLDTLEEYTEKAKEKFGSYVGTLDDAQKMYEEQKQRFVGEGGVLDRVEDGIDNVNQTITQIKEDIPPMITQAKTMLGDTSDTLGNINGLFEGVDFNALKSTFTRLSNELPPAANKILNFFDNPMAAILPSLTAGLVTGAVAKATGRAIAGLAPGVSRPGSINPTNNLRVAAIGAVGLGIAIFGDRIKNWIRDNAGDTIGNIADIVIDVGGAAATGATIGSFFGPGGVLVGAIIGGVVGLGMKLYEWFTGKKEEVDQDAARAIREAEAEYNRKKTEYDAKAAELAGMTDEQQTAATSGMTDAEVGALNQAIDSNPALAFQDEQQRLIREYENLAKGGTMTAFAAQGKLSQIRQLEQEAASEGISIVNYAPTNVQGGPSVGGSTTVQTTQVNAVGGGGGDSSGAPFPAAGN